MGSDLGKLGPEFCKHGSGDCGRSSKQAPWMPLFLSDFDDGYGEVFTLLPTLSLNDGL